jgi:hypothetical protein
VIEQVMADMAKRIEAITGTFDDPGHCYVFGIRNVLTATISDHRWRSLLRRAEVIAGAMYRVMGPYAIRDIQNAVTAGRYTVRNIDLVWRLTTHAIVGFGLAVCDGDFRPEDLDEAVVDLLGMVCVRREEACRLAHIEFPPLPGEGAGGDRRREGRRKMTVTQK